MLNLGMGKRSTASTALTARPANLGRADFEANRPALLAALGGRSDDHFGEAVSGSTTFAPA